MPEDKQPFDPSMFKTLEEMRAAFPDEAKEYRNTTDAEGEPGGFVKRTVLSQHEAHKDDEAMDEEEEGPELSPEISERIMGKATDIDKARDEANQFETEREAMLTAFRQKIEKLLSIFQANDFETFDIRTQVRLEDRTRESDVAAQSDVSPSPQAQRVRRNLDTLLEFKGNVGAVREGLNLPENQIEVFERFKGRPLVDIGAGDNSEGYMISQLLGASGYIAIEPYFAHTLVSNMQHRFGKYRPDTLPPFAVVNEDALSVIKAIEPGAANFMACALDEHILKDPEYNQILGQEIARVVGTDGVFLSYDSVIPVPTLKALASISEGGQFGSKVIIFGE